MATNWYWRQGEQEEGPVSFRELALMVRDRVLNEDNLVRPDYSKEWQTADLVVGLFYMAGRVAALREAQQAPAAEESVAAIDACEEVDVLAESRVTTDTADVQQPLPWTEKDYTLHAFNVSVEGVAPPDPDDSNLPAPSDGRLAAAIEEATYAWDLRHPAPMEQEPPTQPARESRFVMFVVAPLYRVITRLGNLAASLVGVCLRLGQVAGLGALCLWIERVVSRRTLTTGFRYASSISAAVLTGWIVSIWSDYETIRYPDPAWIEAGKRVFPLVGPCSPLEYYFLLFDLLVVVGVAAYFGAKLVEQLADD